MEDILVSEFNLTEDYRGYRVIIDEDGEELLSVKLKNKKVQPYICCHTISNTVEVINVNCNENKISFFIYDDGTVTISGSLGNMDTYSDIDKRVKMD